MHIIRKYPVSNPLFVNDTRIVFYLGIVVQRTSAKNILNLQCVNANGSIFKFMMLWLMRLCVMPIVDACDRSRVAFQLNASNP